MAETDAGDQATPPPVGASGEALTLRAAQALVDAWMRERGWSYWHPLSQLARMSGTSVVVRSNQPLARQLDGDPIGEGRELRARVLAGTLLVRVAR